MRPHVGTFPLIFMSNISGISRIKKLGDVGCHNAECDLILIIITIKLPALNIRSSIQERTKERVYCDKIASSPNSLIVDTCDPHAAVVL